MSLTNPNLPVTEARLQEFYERIKPYLGGGYSAGDGIEISNGEISTDNLQSGDMDDVVTPIPSIPTRVPHKYSTTEQIVGEWIDGKPIYEKTVNLGNLPNTNDKNVAHGIANLDKCVVVTGSAFTPSNTSVPLPYFNPTSLNAGILITADRANITVTTAADRSTWTGQATLQYTKTTT